MRLFLGLSDDVLGRVRVGLILLFVVRVVLGIRVSRSLFPAGIILREKKLF